MSGEGNSASRAARGQPGPTQARERAGRGGLLRRPVATPRGPCSTRCSRPGGDLRPSRVAATRFNVGWRSLSAEGPRAASDAPVTSSGGRPGRGAPPLRPTCCVVGVRFLHQGMCRRGRDIRPRRRKAVAVVCRPTERVASNKLRRRKQPEAAAASPLPAPQPEPRRMREIGPCSFRIYVLQNFRKILGHQSPKQSLHEGSAETSKQVNH